MTPGPVPGTALPGSYPTEARSYAERAVAAAHEGHVQGQVHGLAAMAAECTIKTICLKSHFTSKR